MRRTGIRKSGFGIRDSGVGDGGAAVKNVGQASRLPVTILLVLLLCLPGLLAEDDPVRVLFLTHSAGFEHDVLPVAARTMKEVGPDYGIETTVTDDVAWLTADKLQDFDVLLFYTTGELPVSEAQKQALLDFVRDGGGFAGVHSATDTFYEWETFGDLIGGYFDGHPWHTHVGILVLDGEHPSTRHLGDRFEITDEIYQYRNFRHEGTHILLELDTTSVDMDKEDVRGVDGNFPLAWTRKFGKGKVFYTALGHREDVWKDQRFQKLLLHGILWAADPKN